MNRLKGLNSSINELRIILRNSNERQSAYELNEIIKDTKDARSFIFLLDRFDTDKEITRETIEDLIECTYDFNSLVIEHIDKLHSTTKKSNFNIDGILTWKSFKLALAAAILVGVINGVSNSDRLLKSALNYVGIQIVKDEPIEKDDKDDETDTK